MPNSSNLQRQSISALMVYDRIIKDPDFGIIHQLARREEWKPYIDTERILTLSDEALAYELLIRDDFNPLEAYKIKDFNAEKNYDYFYKELKEMYSVAPAMRMMFSSDSYLTSGHISNLYIWNPVDDPRQRYDLYLTFGNANRLKYVTGSYEKVVEQIKPTLLYDWNIDRVTKLVESEKYKTTFFFVAAYKFNLELSKYGYFKLKNNLEERTNVSQFPPYRNDNLSYNKG